MLAVYTAEQQPIDSTKGFAHALKYCGGAQTPAVCKSNGGFALKTSWCREIALDNYEDMLADLPPGTINIYGIRKHGTGVSYQPRCPGHISRTTAYTDNLFGSFFQMMVELISCVLDDHGMSKSRADGWLQRWGASGFERSVKVYGSPVGPSVSCLLNSNPDDIPELDTSDPGRFWATDDMHGTITGIPSKWVESVPIMSYLLYIPRIWGAFYSSPRVLPKLSKISRRKMMCSPALRSITGSLGNYSPMSYHVKLWTYTAGKMMLPLWCTPCGKEYFWTFTYLLMRAAFGKTFKHDEEITNLVPRLYTSEISSGFRSWLAWYKMRDEAPKFVGSMLSALATSGPSSLVRFGKVAAYL